jgi:hypothetical protein
MSSWALLAGELALWRADGLVPTLWWRDDDATQPSAALDRLLAEAGRARLPLALAVIPAGAGPALAERLAGETAAVLQHGYAHLNHAPAGAKKAELGADRPLATVLEELRRGAQRLARLFGARFRRVLVPPWNRIDAAVAAALPGAGFAGLSTYRPRRSASGGPGLAVVNTHVDIVDWQARGFLGEDSALRLTIDHLAARRGGLVDRAEATGLLTHHAVHQADAWTFVERWVATLLEGGGRFLSADELFEAEA